MNDVRTPAQFFDGFQYATGIEYGTSIVVLVFISVFVSDLQAILEVIVIIDKVYLHTCSLYGCYLDDKRMVRVINDQIHTGKAYHFVQLVSAFVDISPLGMKVRISLPFSWMACGKCLPTRDISVSETYGVISCVINKTLFAFVIITMFSIILQRYKNRAIKQTEPVYNSL